MAGIISQLHRADDQVGRSSCRTDSGRRFAGDDDLRDGQHGRCNPRNNDYACRAVVRGASHSCVVVELPFGSYGESPKRAFRGAGSSVMGINGAIRDPRGTHGLWVQPVHQPNQHDGVGCFKRHSAWWRKRGQGRGPCVRTLTISTKWMPLDFTGECLRVGGLQEAARPAPDAPQQSRIYQQRELDFTGTSAGLCRAAESKITKFQRLVGLIHWILPGILISFPNTLWQTRQSPG